MIVTVTPNPSLDRSLEVAALERGGVLRAEHVRVDPGGKGINVATALTVNGHPSRAVVPAGGYEGDQLCDAVTAAGIDVIRVPIDHPIRTNISLVEPDGTVTKVNAPGPAFDDTQTQALTHAAVDAIEDATWVAGCGSLPPGAPDDLYARLVEAAHTQGARVAIDAAGAALLAALDAGPDLIKPNVHELAEATGRVLRRLGDVLDAASELHQRGVACVAASLGPDGAVLLDADGVWHATTPPIVVRSAVGAGDSMVAGLLAAGGHGPAALRHGVAYGSAAAQLPGTQLPRPHDLDLEAVTVTALDPDRILTEPGGKL